MTSGRAPHDPFAVGFGSAPTESRHDQPYGDGRADGFGGRGPAADGFGGPPLGGLAPGGRSGAHGAEESHLGTAPAPAPGALTPQGVAPTTDVRAATRLAAPPSIDFGEVVAGEHPTESVHVFNLHPTYEAGVRISLAGDPELAIVSKPDRLRPSGEGLGAPIVLAYQPTKRRESKAGSPSRPPGKPMSGR